MAIDGGIGNRRDGIVAVFTDSFLVIKHRVSRGVVECKTVVASEGIPLRECAVVSVASCSAFSFRFATRHSLCLIIRPLTR